MVVHVLMSGRSGVGCSFRGVMLASWLLVAGAACHGAAERSSDRGVAAQPLPSGAASALAAAVSTPAPAASAAPRKEPNGAVASGTAAQLAVDPKTGRDRLARLLFAGDLAMSLHVGHRLNTDPEALNAGYPLAGVAERIRAADWAIGNLECVASVKGALATGHNPFRCAAQALPALRLAGFDTLSVANNHAHDFGRQGFADMLVNLRREQLEQLGAASFGTKIQAPVVRTLAGSKIGLLAYYYPPDDPERDIAACRASLDVLIIFNHWGQEGTPEPLLGQRLLGRAQIDAGADLVLGTHAHLRQPSEWYRGRFIAYGLGNAVFSGMSDRSAQLQGAFLEADVADRRIVALRLLPIVLNRAGEPRFSLPPDQVSAERPTAEPDRSPRQRLLPAPIVWRRTAG